MTTQTKIVKGGFRATLALIISVIALILSIFAYNASTKEEEVNARIKDLQTRMEKMKQESSKQIDKLRGDTANALERLGRKIKKEEKTEEEIME